MLRDLLLQRHRRRHVHPDLRDPRNGRRGAVHGHGLGKRSAPLPSPLRDQDGHLPDHPVAAWVGDDPRRLLLWSRDAGLRDRHGHVLHGACGERCLHEPERGALQPLRSVRELGPGSQRLLCHHQPPRCGEGIPHQHGGHAPLGEHRHAPERGSCGPLHAVGFGHGSLGRQSGGGPGSGLSDRLLHRRDQHGLHRAVRDWGQRRPDHFLHGCHGAVRGPDRRDSQPPGRHGSRRGGSPHRGRFPDHHRSGHQRSYRRQRSLHRDGPEQSRIVRAGGTFYGRRLLHRQELHDSGSSSRWLRRPLGRRDCSGHGRDVPRVHDLPVRAGYPRSCQQAGHPAR